MIDGFTLRPEWPRHADRKQSNRKVVCTRTQGGAPGHEAGSSSRCWERTGAHVLAVDRPPPVVLESPILAPLPILMPHHCCPFTSIFHYTQVSILAGCKYLQERGRSHKRHLSPALLEEQWSRSWPCWNYRGKGVVFGIMGGYDQVCFSLEAQSSLRTIFLADLFTDQQSLHQSRHWNPPGGLL